MFKKFLLSFIIIGLCNGPVLAQEPVLNPNHPDEYTVVKGDTLWDISERFLNTPWLWPEVWHANPQIENPHLIYPGDVVSLIYVDGKPQLRLSRGGSQPSGNLKLSPEIRTTALSKAIPTIPIEKIQQFLSRSGVVTEEEYNEAAYIVAADAERLVSGASDKVYTRRTPEEKGKHYVIIRKGRQYTNPLDEIGLAGGKAGEELGYEAVHLGDLAITKYGDPATALIIRSLREILKNDRLLVAGKDSPDTHFFPHSPAEEVEGSIVGIVDGVENIGSYDVVAVNFGKRNNAEVGHVLDIYRKGRTVPDTAHNNVSGTKSFGQTKVRLPDEKTGTLMIFRVFDKVSYALVLSATDRIKNYDIVKNPK